jgi:tRNA(Ile)-lysidine synthase
VIQHWLRSLGATPGAREVLDIEEALLHPGASGRMDLGEGRVIERRLGVWRAAPAAEPAPGDLRLRLPGRRQDEGDGWILEAAPCRGYRRERERGVGRYPARAWIDARRAEGRLLRLRTWCAGDRMRPWGRGGSAKIQDVLTAAGVKGADRRRVRVLECGGDIVWLPGYRIALDWAVPDSSAPSWRLELRRARRL